MSSPPSEISRADIKVVGLGLGRTGTMSLSKALEMLGFGPCYHPMLVPPERDDWLAWAYIAEEDSSPEAYDRILKGYHAVVDSPVAITAPAVYAAYPNAKYILTVRDPSKWENSMRETTMKAWNNTRYLDVSLLSPEIQSLFRWAKSYFVVYHRDRLETHTQEEFQEHTRRVQELIPPDQLLIFDVSEGWEKLANFLGVPIPNEPFPRLNDRATFMEVRKSHHDELAAFQNKS